MNKATLLALSIVTNIFFITSCQPEEKKSCLEYEARCSNLKKKAEDIVNSGYVWKADLQNIVALEVALRDSMSALKLSDCYTDNSIDYVNSLWAQVTSREQYLSINGNTSKTENSQQDVVKHNPTKWVYFGAYVPENSLSKINYYYSKIYKIQDFTNDKLIEVNDCLLEILRKYSNEQIVMNEHLFSSLSEASDKWESEHGIRIFGDNSCLSDPIIRYEDVFPNNK